MKLFCHKIGAFGPLLLFWNCIFVRSYALQLSSLKTEHCNLISHSETIYLWTSSRYKALTIMLRGVKVESRWFKFLSSLKTVHSNLISHSETLYLWASSRYKYFTLILILDLQTIKPAIQTLLFLQNRAFQLTQKHYITEVPRVTNTWR